jgi:hypothetical protein
MKDTQIRNQIRRLLSNEVSLREFQKWYVPATWDIDRSNEASSKDIASEIDLKLAEYTSGHLAEPELRHDLSKILENQTVEILIGVSVKQRYSTALSSLQLEIVGALS